MHSLEDRVRRLLDEIARRAANRPVTLVAVSKTVGPAAVRAARAVGLRDFGENRTDALEEKLDALEDLDDLRWHFIGHLQRNKVRRVVGRVALIHSVDSLRLLRAIDEEAARREIVQDCLLQFNTSGEESKQGFAPERAPEILETAASCPNVRLLGLMTMAPFVEDRDVVRRCFARLRTTGEELARLAATRPGAPDRPLFVNRELSMGMSNDYETALDEGATLLRIGTAVFAEAE